MTNGDLQYLNSAGSDFNIYLAFLNPVKITTNWVDLNMDAQGNWLPPPNYDTAAHHVQPYAPTANLGPNRIGFVGEPLYFDGSRSCWRFDYPVVTGTHAWAISGPYSSTSYSSNSQIAVSWSQAGIYTVSLTVTDKAGTTTTGTRQVMIYQDRQSALPGTISLSGLSGSLSNGGWQMQCTTVNSQFTLYAPDQLPPGTYQPVVILAETRFEIEPGVWVNRTIAPHGLFNPGYPYVDPRILFDGYVQNGTVHQDVDKDTLSFSCVGPQMILQEAKTHQLGYYNCNNNVVTNGVTQSLKVSSVGNGFQVGGLMMMDVIHSLLQYHSNVGKFHDIHLWASAIPTQPYQPNNTNAHYYLIYTTLSVNEGTIWQNMQDLTNNEFCTIYCERDGSICSGPQINYRGGDFWNTPTLEGGLTATFLINYAQDLGYTVGNTLSTMAANMPTLPAQPFPVTYVHPWGRHATPPQFLKPFGDTNPQIQATQASLLGQPVLCIFSDTPVYDLASTPPDTTNLYPHITNNWPQDLAIYPISFDVTENYMGRAALVKLIGTLYGHTTLWSSWWPQNTFQFQGNGTVSVVTSTLPASDWIVNEQYVLPDVTTRQDAVLVWNYWWEMAKREYFAHNMNYNLSVTTPMFTAANLGDVVAITRQNITLGPAWNNKLFVIKEIDHDLDLTNRTWQTVLTLDEVTSAAIGSISPPPTGVPKG